MARAMLWVMLAVVIQGDVARPPSSCGDVPQCSCTGADTVVMHCEGAGLSRVPVGRSKDASKVAGLALSDNRIGSLPAGSFSAYPGARYVYISNCGTRAVHRDAFEGLVALEELDLSFNPLRELHPDTFAGNPALRTLSLMGDELLRLPPQGPILSSRSLAKLDLSYCGVGELSPEAFAGLANLRRLDLTSNKLASLPTATLRPLKLLEELKVDGNEWACDCRLHELLGWTGRLRGQQVQYRDTRCIAGNGRDLVLWSYEEQGRRCAAEDVSTWTAASPLPSATSVGDRRETWTKRTTSPTAKTIHSRKPKIISQKDRDVDEEMIEVEIVEERRTLNSFKPDEVSLRGKLARAGDLEPGALHLGDREASVNNEGGDGQVSFLSSRMFQIVFIVVLACTGVAVVVLTALLIKYTCSAGHHVYRRIRLSSQNSHQYESAGQP